MTVSGTTCGVATQAASGPSHAGPYPPTVPPDTEYVQNGDMSSTAGWDNVLPAGGVLDVGASETAINQLLAALTNGVEYTLRYNATVLSGSPAGVIRLHLGIGNQTIANPIVADGEDQVSTFTATAGRTTARIIETGGSGTFRFTLLSIIE